MIIDIVVGWQVDTSSTYLVKTFTKFPTLNTRVQPDELWYRELEKLVIANKQWRQETNATCKSSRRH